MRSCGGGVATTPKDGDRELSPVLTYAEYGLILSFRNMVPEIALLFPVKCFTSLV